MAIAGMRWGCELTPPYTSELTSIPPVEVKGGEAQRVGQDSQWLCCRAEAVGTIVVGVLSQSQFARAPNTITSFFPEVSVPIKYTPEDTENNLEGKQDQAAEFSIPALEKHNTGPSYKLLAREVEHYDWVRLSVIITFCWFGVIMITVV